MKHGEIFPRILAKFGIPVDIQHGNIKVGYGYGPFQIPGGGKICIRNHQLPPEFFMGFPGNSGKKTPIQPFNQFKTPDNNRVDPLVPDYRGDKFL
jgi:hypothetical protein